MTDGNYLNENWKKKLPNKLRNIWAKHLIRHIALIISSENCLHSPQLPILYFIICSCWFIFQLASRTDTDVHIMIIEFSIFFLLSFSLLSMVHYCWKRAERQAFRSYTEGKIIYVVAVCVYNIIVLYE